MAEKREFKAESKRLMDLMINSIYTHKEIFLRELISNASDALDKLYFESINNGKNDINKDDLKIDLSIDSANRTITIADNGIGMDENDLENHLGTIAKSGSYDFKQANDMKEEDEIDVIGQFGVGFYSAFMVADKVEVTTKKYGSDKAYKWVSENSDGYSIEECDKDSIGTTIVLTLKENSDDVDYDEYLDNYRIQKLVTKYSDYIRYPIKMDVEETKQLEDDKTETVVENKTLNSMVPLWKRNKSDISDEEYNEFYKSKFNDYMDPLKVIHTNVEGTISFNSLLFIPSHTPMDYYTQDYEKGLQLYSSGVFIMDHAEELVPDYFRFVRGLVDSQDLSLNISREMLQQDKQLRVIASKIEKKIKSELEKMLKNDRETYNKFWNTFGTQLKYGVYQDYGMHKDKLKDLLMFYSSTKNEFVTLSEYVERMKDDQEAIYYMSGESFDKIDALPQAEMLRDKGIEVLYLTEDIDEFVMQTLMNYNEKPLKNAAQGDLDLSSDEEKEKIKEANEEHKEMLEKMKEALNGEVSEVKISSRLKSHPVCLVAAEGMSFEMEKVLNNMPEGNAMGMKATRILELNPNHDLFKTLVKVYNEDVNKLNDYAEILYDQALLMEGFKIDDPIKYAQKVSELMIQANKE